MDTTVNRGYPYPQCDPPAVKDIADMPQQMHALAVAVDADITVVADVADAALNPPFVATANPFAQVLIPGAGVDIGPVVSARDVTVAAGAATVQDAGLWLITGSVSAGVAPTVFHNLTLRVNGEAVRTSSLNPNAVGGDPLDNLTYAYVVLAVGDVLSMSQNFTGAASITYTAAHLSAVLVARFS
jgi:hypothetical protein